MFQGSTCVVTGASSGLGVEFARALDRRGAARLVLVARRRDRLEALASELGCEAVVESVDLLDREAVRALIGRHEPDVVINNAGFGRIGSAVEGSAESMVTLNVDALTWLVEGWLPGMVRRGRGGLLNVGSTAGMVATPGMAAYSATKAYVNTLTEGLHLELLGTGVRVSLLAPGPVATEFFDVAAPKGTAPPAFVMQRPDVTVKAALNGLERNKPVIIPGLVWLAMFSRKWTPEWVVRLFMRVYGRTLQGMAQ